MNIYNENGGGGWAILYRDALAFFRLRHSRRGTYWEMHDVRRCVTHWTSHSSGFEVFFTRLHVACLLRLDAHNAAEMTRLPHNNEQLRTNRIYKVGQKSDTSRTLHYIVREVSLFWPTLYMKFNNGSQWAHTYATKKFLLLRILDRKKTSAFKSY